MSARRIGEISPAQEVEAAIAGGQGPQTSGEKGNNGDKELRASIESLRSQLPKRLSAKETSLIGLLKAVKAENSKKYTSAELQKYKTTLEIFLKISSELRALSKGADVGQKIIDVLTELAGQEKVLDLNYISKINNTAVLEYFGISSEEESVPIESGEGGEESDEENIGREVSSDFGRNEEPVAGETIMYIPPRRNETEWKEVLFMGFGGDDGNDTTKFRVKLPGGGIFPFDRYNKDGESRFYKTPDLKEGETVISFDNNARETRRSKERKEFADAQTVYFLAPEKADHAGKYREGKIVLDAEGRKKVWFGSFDKKGEKKLNSLRLSDLLDSEGLEELRKSNPELEVVPFEERPPRSLHELVDPSALQTETPSVPEPVETEPRGSFAGNPVKGEYYNIYGEILYIKDIDNGGKDEIQFFLIKDGKSTDKFLISRQEWKDFLEENELTLADIPFSGDLKVNHPYTQENGDILTIESINTLGKGLIKFSIRDREGKKVGSFKAPRGGWDRFVKENNISFEADVELLGNPQVDQVFVFDEKLYRIVEVDPKKGVIVDEYRSDGSRTEIPSSPISRQEWNQLQSHLTPATAEQKNLIEYPPGDSRVLSREELEAIVAKATGGSLPSSVEPAPVSSVEPSPSVEPSSFVEPAPDSVTLSQREIDALFDAVNSGRIDADADEGTEILPSVESFSGNPQPGDFYMINNQLRQIQRIEGDGIFYYDFGTGTAYRYSQRDWNENIQFPDHIRPATDSERHDYDPSVFFVDGQKLERGKKYTNGRINFEIRGLIIEDKDNPCLLVEDAFNIFPIFLKELPPLREVEEKKDIFIGNPRKDHSYLIVNEWGDLSAIIYVQKVTDTEIVYKDLLQYSLPVQKCNPTEWAKKVQYSSLEDNESSPFALSERGRSFEIGGRSFEIGKQYYSGEDQITIHSVIPNINLDEYMIEVRRNDGNDFVIDGKNILNFSENPTSGDGSSFDDTDLVDTAFDPDAMHTGENEENKFYTEAYNFFETRQKATFSEFVEHMNVERQDAVDIMRKLLENHILVEKKKFGIFGKPIYHFVPEDRRPRVADSEAIAPETSSTDTTAVVDTLSPISPEATESQEVPIDLDFNFIPPAQLKDFLEKFSIASINESQGNLTKLLEEIQTMFDDLTEEDFQKFSFAKKYGNLPKFQEMWKNRGADMLMSMLDEMTAHNLQCAINANPELKKLLAVHNNLSFKDSLKRSLLWGAGSGLSTSLLMRFLTASAPGVIPTAAFVGTVTLRMKEHYDFRQNQKIVDTKKDTTKVAINDKFLEFQQSEIVQDRLDRMAKLIAFRDADPQSRQEIYRRSLEGCIFSLEMEIEDKKQALEALSVTATAERQPLENEILELTRKKIMLKADRALHIHKNNREGLSKLTYNRDVLAATKNSAFFGEAWKEATYGDKRLSKQFSNSRLDRAFGHFVAGAVNALSAFTVAHSLPGHDFWEKFGIRGIVASVVKGTQAGVLNRRNVEAVRRREIRSAAQLLDSRDIKQLEKIDAQMESAQRVAGGKDLAKAVGKSAVTAAAVSGSIGSVFDLGRDYLFGSESESVSENSDAAGENSGVAVAEESGTQTEQIETPQTEAPHHPATLSGEQKAAAAYAEPTRANAEVLANSEYPHTPNYNKFLDEFNKFIEKGDTENARIRLVWMLQEGGSPADNARNIHHLVDMLPKQQAIAYKSIFFLRDENHPDKLFVKIDPTRQGLYATIDNPQGSHIVEVTPNNLHEVFVARNATPETLDNVLKTFQPAEAPPASAAPQVEAPASAPELSPDGNALSEKVLADIKYIHSYKSEYLDKLVNSIGEKSQDIVTSAHNKLKIIEDLIRSRAEAGNSMSSEEIVKELQSRSTSDEWLLLNSDNTCNSDHPIVVNKNSFAFFDKITGQRFFHNDPGKIYTLQDQEHLRIHDISTNTDKVVSLRDVGGGKLEILEKLH